MTGSAALPTYILFDKNVEVARFPEPDFEMKVSPPPITKVLSKLNRKLT